MNTYDFENGGFSQERPEPILEVGKSYKDCDGKYFVINRVGDRDNYGIDYEGKWRDDLLCSAYYEWQEIPESEAIELLRQECVRWGGEDWKDVKIRECLYHGEICNHGKYDITVITTSEIWNRNGCIFKDGVWAEKLDEPKLKPGQMVWGDQEY